MSLKRFFKDNHLSICGRDFDVVYAQKPRDEDNVPAYGLTDHDKQAIIIDKTLRPEQEMTTIIHESLHGISEILKVKMSESDICRLENGIHNLLKHNPRLCKAYIHLGEGKRL